MKTAEQNTKIAYDSHALDVPLPLAFNIRRKGKVVTYPVDRCHHFTLLSDSTRCDAHRVAMTKAAVKNMLRLMEDVDPGGDGAVELDQYAHFILQQSEITVAGREGCDNNDDDNSFTTRNALCAATMRDAGTNDTPFAAGACSATFDAVGVSAHSTTAAMVPTGGPTTTAVNLAMVPGNDIPEEPQSTLRQPAGDGIAGGDNFVDHSGGEGENAGDCHPHYAELNNKNGTGGDFGGVNNPRAIGREGDNISGSGHGGDAPGIPGGVEEAAVADQRGQHHGSTHNSLSMLSAGPKEEILLGNVASKLLVVGKGGDPVPEAPDTSFSPELKVRKRKYKTSMAHRSYESTDHSCLRPIGANFR